MIRYNSYVQVHNNIESYMKYLPLVVPWKKSCRKKSRAKTKKSCRKKKSRATKNSHTEKKSRAKKKVVPKNKGRARENWRREKETWWEKLDGTNWAP